MKALHIMKTNFQGQNININNKHSHVFLPFLQERRVSPQKTGQRQNRIGTQLPCRQAPSPTRGRRIAITPHDVHLTNCHNQIHHTGDTPCWRRHSEEGSRSHHCSAGLSPQHRPEPAGLCSFIGWPLDTSDHRNGDDCTCRQLPQPTSTKAHGPEPGAEQSPASGWDQPDPETGHRIHTPHPHPTKPHALVHAPGPHLEFTSCIHILYPILSLHFRSTSLVHNPDHP